VTKTFTGSALCSNSVFGDPLPGFGGKTCSFSSTVIAAAAPTTTWTDCAREYGTCSFSGTRQVRFGVNGVYSTKTFTGTAACTVAAFGDPYPGVGKSCSYANATN
jgi:hypothetical protein